MDIRIADEYHSLRVTELELTADYLEKRAEEKERERQERERLKEEQRAQQEMERERARLEKEREHHLNALEALEAKGDEEGSERMRQELAEVDEKIEDVEHRAANVRAGYVYGISNVGALGEGVVKIGLTRRPHERPACRVPGAFPPSCPQRLLDRPAPERIRRSFPSCRGCIANRRMRTRTSGVSGRWAEPGV